MGLVFIFPSNEKIKRKKMKKEVVVALFICISTSHAMEKHSFSNLIIDEEDQGVFIPKSPMHKLLNRPEGFSFLRDNKQQELPLTPTRSRRVTPIPLSPSQDKRIKEREAQKRVIQSLATRLACVKIVEELPGQET